MLDLDEHPSAKPAKYANLVQDPKEMEEAEQKVVDDEADPIRVRRVHVAETIRRRVHGRRT